MVTLRPLRPNAFRPPRGQKPIYLPNFTLTLLRNAHLPPNFASFIVPLSFNKLDLKDYLYNLYNVRVLSVRSFIKQQRVRQDKPHALLPKSRRWYRPRAVKKMMVEMDDGGGGNGNKGWFVWPEEPSDLSPWDKETYDAAQAEQEAEQQLYGPEADMIPKKDKGTIAEQARALLEGREVWRGSGAEYGVGVRRRLEGEGEADRGRVRGKR